MAETSYPFLRIAREFGVPYGQVLAYRDVLEKYDQSQPAQSLALDCWEYEAVLSLGNMRVAKAIDTARQKENARRAAAIGGDRA